MDITQTEIDDMRRLHEAATPGPWEAATLSPKGLIPAIIQRDQDDWLPVAYFADEHGDGEAVDMEENRALIVAARNAIPALLDAAEDRDALKAKLAALESSLAEMAVKLDEGIECYPSSPCNIFATLLELQGLWRGKPSAKVQP